MESAEHGHLTRAESNEFTSQNQDECVEKKVASQGEVSSKKDGIDCAEYQVKSCSEYPLNIVPTSSTEYAVNFVRTSSSEYPVNIVNNVPPVVSSEDKPRTLGEELVVYTEEMALFHRHEITSPRYSFNVPTEDQVSHDVGHLESNDVFIDKDKRLYDDKEKQPFSENVGGDSSNHHMHISQGLFGAYDFNSVPVVPWASTEKPQHYNPSLSGARDICDIPRLSDLYDSEEEGILGVVMEEDRGKDAHIATHHWGYQSYDAGYGTPLRMIDYYDAVDSTSGPDSGKGDREKTEVKKFDLEMNAVGGGQASDIDCGQDGDVGEGVYQGDDEHVVDKGGCQIKYYLDDGDCSAENTDCVFANSGNVVKYSNDQMTGKLRRLSSYDNTVTPDDRMVVDGETLCIVEPTSLKDLLKEVKNPEPNNEMLPELSKPDGGSGSHNVLTLDYVMTTTSSGDTSPALRECTIGMRVTSRDSLAGLAPEWEESRSSSDDAAEQLEKLAISNISSAYGQAPVIKESEGGGKTINSSFVSKLKRELGEGLILPSLQSVLIKGNEKFGKDMEMMKGGEHILSQEQVVRETCQSKNGTPQQEQISKNKETRDQGNKQNQQPPTRSEKTVDKNSVKDFDQNSFGVLKGGTSLVGVDHEHQNEIGYQTKKQQPGIEKTQLHNLTQHSGVENGVKYLEQQNSEQANNEIQLRQQSEACELASVSELEMDVIVGLVLESREIDVKVNNARDTQAGIGEGCEILESRPNYAINENNLESNEQTTCEEGKVGHALEDKRQIVIYVDGQSNRNESWLDHGTNEMNNQSVNDIGEYLVKEVDYVGKQSGSDSANAEGKTGDISGLLNVAAYNSELEKNINSHGQEITLDLQEGARNRTLRGTKIDVQKGITHVQDSVAEIKEGMSNVHKETLNNELEETYDIRVEKHDGRRKTHENLVTETEKDDDVQEGSWYVPDIAVWSSEEHKVENQVKDTESVDEIERVNLYNLRNFNVRGLFCEDKSFNNFGCSNSDQIKEIEVRNLQGLDKSHCNGNVNYRSNDGSSNSSDATKCFPENSVNEELHIFSNSKKPYDTNISVGNIEKRNKSISEDSDVSMKRRASFFESAVIRYTERQGEVKMEGKDIWSELNQPKPPPEGNSKRCVNAR